MAKSKEIPFSPEYMRDQLLGGVEIGPLEILMALEEIELRMRSENYELKLEIKKTKGETK